MSHHILEIQKVDEGGNHVPPSDFYVVDETGRKVSKRCDSIDEAIGELLSLETKKKLDAEKSRKKDTGQER